jgi:hypothetical protein
MRTLAALLVSLPLALASATAAAQAVDPAAAQSLFDEGKRLMSQQRFAEARDKLAESERLDPGIGTLFHLAECEERMGETAREATARERAAALRPRISLLTIEPGAETGASGLEVQHDGTVVERAQWGVPIPLDPGQHTIEVRATEKGTWRETVDLRAGSTRVVTVPLLATLPASAPAPSNQELEASLAATTAAEIEARRKRQHITGVVIGVAGIVGLGIGTAYGVKALHDQSDVNGHCGPTGCDATGAALQSTENTNGAVSAVALAAGGIGLIVGIVMYATAPHSTSSTQVAFGPGGPMVGGTF